MGDPSDRSQRPEYCDQDHAYGDEQFAFTAADDRLPHCPNGVSSLQRLKTRAKARWATDAIRNARGTKHQPR